MRKSNGARHGFYPVPAGRVVIAALGLALALVLMPGRAGGSSAGGAGKSAALDGVDFYHKGDLSSAEAKFREALKAEPENRQALDYLGRIERRYAKAARALVQSARRLRAQRNRDLRKILAVLPKDAESLRRLYDSLEREAGANPGENLDWLFAPPLGEPGVPAEPLAKWRGLRESLVQEESRRLVREGALLMERNQKEKALIRLAEALALRPDDPEALRMILQARRVRTETANVDELYRQAAESYAEKDFAAAAAKLESLLTLDPGHADARRYLEKIKSLSPSSAAP